MSSMRKVAILAGTAAAILMAGCSASGSMTGTGAQSATAASGSRATGSGGTASSSTLTSPEQVCLQAFGPAVLLDWTGGTVAQFRAYQYGGPKATFPLEHAFPGVPGSTPGAWCGTKEGPQTTRWWAAVPGHKPVMVITITGPGEGVKRGYVATPPYVP